MKHTPLNWNLDIRVGCIAIYSGNEENCLSGMQNSPRTIFYKTGLWDKKNECWNNDPQDEIMARLVFTAVTSHYELLELAKLILESQSWDGNDPDEEKWSILYKNARSIIAKAEAMEP